MWRQMNENNTEKCYFRLLDIIKTRQVSRNSKYSIEMKNENENQAEQVGVVVADRNNADDTIILNDDNDTTVMGNDNDVDQNFNNDESLATNEQTADEAMHLENTLGTSFQQASKAVNRFCTIL
jgi:hypothetical protein